MTLVSGDLEDISPFIETLMNDADAATAQETLGLADTVRSDKTATLSAGYATGVADDGIISSGTYTPAIGDDAENFKKITNGGAFALGVPATNGDIKVDVTNNASAGLIDLSAFDAVDGDAITTTDGDVFRLYITVLDARSHLSIKAFI